MKKLTLVAIACTSILATPFAFAGSSYVTGNVQVHDRADFNGSDVTSTLEAGHTFDTNTTLLVEFDGLQLGRTDYGKITPEHPSDNSSASSFTTIGLEQAFNLTDHLWVAVGYHHLLHDGAVFQYRPLVKIGYNFDNGLSLSNRTRMQIQAHNAAVGDTNDQLRLDDKIAYQFQDTPLALSYNNVFYVNEGSGKDNSMEHELRATWTRTAGVQPYIEYRNQEDSSSTPGHNNNVLVMGASYGF